MESSSAAQSFTGSTSPRFAASSTLNPPPQQLSMPSVSKTARVSGNSAIVSLTLRAQSSVGLASCIKSSSPNGGLAHVTRCRSSGARPQWTELLEQRTVTRGPLAAVALPRQVRERMTNLLQVPDLVLHFLDLALRT